MIRGLHLLVSTQRGHAQTVRHAREEQAPGEQRVIIQERPNVSERGVEELGLQLEAVAAGELVSLYRELPARPTQE